MSRAVEAAALPRAMTPAPWRVLSKRQDTADTWTLEIEPRERHGGHGFEPGQFAMLYVFGAGEVPISVSEIGTDGLTHTVRAIGATTERICAVEPGEELGLRGPFGTSWPMAAAVGKDVVIVAGGIGLAPVRPAVLQVLENRDEYGRVSILYGGRSPEELLYVSELEHWRGRFDVDVDVTVDAAPQSWHGRVGLVTKLIPRASFDPPETVAIMCGPEIMMRFTAAGLRERGVPASGIYVSMERSMKCAIGHCGHCQLGPAFICKDGPVFRWDVAEAMMEVREL